MEKRIELERRARKANQITELNLDNCRSTSIVGLTDEYTALESLSLINVGLTTLKGFPKLPSLKKLELSDNRISNGLQYLHTSPKLQYLNLSGNKIKDLETLKPLEEFKNLAVLDLFNNEATHIDNYRDKIFEMLPSLKFLDGYDCNDVEAPSDGEDDDEVNGNDSDDDSKNSAFCLNGLEIDLAEFETYEKRVQAKKLQNNKNNTNNNQATSEDYDDLDEYLRQLQLQDSSNNNKNSTTTNTTTISRTNCATANINVPQNCADTSNIDETVSTDVNNCSTRFVILLYWFLAILNLANAARLSDDDDDTDDSDDDNGDVSLAEVYNDDLEEDNSDWDEDDAVDDDEDEDEDDDDDAEADGGANNSTTEAATDAKASEAKAAAADDAQDESQSRGKKRKHDG